MKYFLLLFIVGLAAATDLKGVRKVRHVYKRQAGGCLYEGRTYQQGQSWTVPCKYNCQCTDASTGHYTCKDICPTYGNLPQGCQLVKDASGCCSSPKCSFTPSGGGTGGTGGGQVMINGGGSMTTSCVDKLQNCKDYGDAVCTDPTYASWVTDNCANFCGKCGGSMTGGTMTGGTMTGGTMTGGTGGTMTGGTMTGGTGGGDGGFHLFFGTKAPSGGTGSMTNTGVTCMDKQSNCADYARGGTCTDPKYSGWVRDNCARTCLCSGGSVYTGMVATGTGGTMTGTGGTMTGTGGTGGTMTGTGGTMTGTGGTYPGTGGTGTGGTLTGGGTYQPGTGGTGTGGTGGTITGTGGTGGTYPGTGGTGGTYPGTGGGTYQPGTGGTGTVTGTGGTGGTYPGTGGTGTGGTGTGGTYPGTGGTGTGGTYPGTGGTGTGGTLTGTGGGTYQPGTGTGGTGGTGGMVGSGTYQVACMDKIPNCKDYGTTVCSDPQYAGWVKDNCAKTCNKCSYLTGSGTMIGTGGTGTMTGTGGTGVITGTSGGVVPILQPGGGTYPGQTYYPGGMTGTGTGTGMTGTGTGTGMTGTGTGTGMTGTGTGTGMTGTGTGTGMTGTGTGMTGTMTGSCTGDKAGVDCSSYGASVCSDPKYAGWVSDNCCLYCMTHGGHSGGHMTGTGTGSQHSISGQSTGCAYKGQVYQQGQAWKDGCEYKCTCVNAQTGQYNCQALCVQWQLPQVCTLNQPAPGKCCQTPNCPSNVNLQYPPNYVAE